MDKLELKIFADYYQFYLQDENAEGNLSDSWTEDAVKNLIALAPGTIGIGTVRNNTVPVLVEILDNKPDNDFNEWDKVNECSIEVLSGKIVIAGCTDYFPDAKRIQVKSGVYRVRVYYKNLNTISQDGLNGNDFYKVTIWLDNQNKPLEILK